MMKIFGKVYRRVSILPLILFEKLKMTENTFMVILSALIGILVGFSAVGFRQLIEHISAFSFQGTGKVLDNIIASPWYILILVPTIGGLIVGCVIHFIEKDAKGHGVPEVMESLIVNEGTIRPKVSIAKACISAITIGTGGSVGREGPIVGIGAGIASSIGRLLRLSNSSIKTLVGCGAAAGIAAAFNAPIAGALFSAEILLGNFNFAQFSPIVISSVTATVISQHFEGNFSAFKVPQYNLTSPYELFLYLLLGLACAILSVVFIKFLYASEDLFENRIRLPQFLKPALGGLLVGSIALIFPHIMGVGYDSIDYALNGKLVWQLAGALIMIKIVATSLTIGSGGAGGIFVPSLFIGAMLGTFFGSIVHSIFPTITSSPGAYALVAMGGLITGTMHAPLTAIIMGFELTNDYYIILPLMITCIISTLLSTRLSPESIYTLHLLKKNIHIKDGTDLNVMESIFVKDVYSVEFESVNENSVFNELVDKFISGNDPCFPVLNKRNKFSGMISIFDIKDYLFEKETLQNVLIARDIALIDIEPVKLEDNCQTVLDKLGLCNLQGLPVITSKKSKQIIGMIWRKDIHEQYNREIERRDIASSFAKGITMKNIDQNVHFMEGYAISEIAIPISFVGKSIKELDVRARYGVDVLLIRNNSKDGSKIKAIPNPDYRFSFNDSLVIAGEVNKINHFKNKA